MSYLMKRAGIGAGVGAALGAAKGAGVGALAGAAHGGYKKYVKKDKDASVLGSAAKGAGVGAAAGGVGGAALGHGAEKGAKRFFQRGGAEFNRQKRKPF